MVSVIVPVYNAEKTIEKCINSIRMQTYNNIEIIALDDGSSDNSLNILKKLQETEPRLTVLHHDNCGVSHTRNLGIQQSKGRYIQFVDSDDIIDSQMTEKMVDRMQSRTADLVMCLFAYPNKKTNNIFEFEEESIVCFYQHFVEIMDNVLFQGPCNKLYRSQIIKEHKIRFPEKVSKLEDSIFNAIYIKYCKRVNLLTEALYIYNYQENSLSHSFHADEISAMICFYQHLALAVDNLREKEVLKHNIFSYAFNQMEVIYRITWIQDKKGYKEKWLTFQMDMNRQDGYNLLEPYIKNVNFKLKLFFWLSKNDYYILTIVYFLCIETIKKVVRR